MGQGELGETGGVGRDKGSWVRQGKMGRWAGSSMECCAHGGS